MSAKVFVYVLRIDQIQFGMAWGDEFIGILEKGFPEISPNETGTAGQQNLFRLRSLPATKS